MSEYDYDINQPIGSATTGVYLEFCKTSKEWVNTVDTLTAGSSYQVEFAPDGISHSGGHCEFSVSYDSGKTFVVIHQELRYCLVGKKPSNTIEEVLVSSYTFDIPSDLPSSDRAIFAWTWVNASGNREFYMNCADVEITGSSSTSYTGKEITIANYKGYPTIPEFNDDYENGIELYTSAKQITVTSSGKAVAKSNPNTLSSTVAKDKSSASVEKNSSSSTEDNDDMSNSSKLNKNIGISVNKSSSSSSEEDNDKCEGEMVGSSNLNENIGTAAENDTISSSEKEDDDKCEGEMVGSSNSNENIGTAAENDTISFSEEEDDDKCE
ncbi:hypothetical protein GGF37_005010, partial [Kickxella alabastrina]